ncbi:hypothetical protein BZK31_17750 [Pseudomonas floridensis]|uniref:Uncharacterized protein n=1 Tax=Pseudomonas floridensis TaxID=1958950 RepID=A0A1X0N3I0_9PSED|nr:hypothetical protein BZK31_17750 [Pseudomonas floridensis]
MASGVLFMVNRNYWVIRDGMRAGIHRVLRWHGHNASTVRSHDKLESKEVVARVVRVGMSTRFFKNPPAPGFTGSQGVFDEIRARIFHLLFDQEAS